MFLKVTRGQMGFIGTSCVLLLLNLLCVSSAVSSNNRLMWKEQLLNQLVDPNAGKINEDMVNDLMFLVKIETICLRNFDSVCLLIVDLNPSYVATSSNKFTMPINQLAL